MSPPDLRSFKFAGRCVLALLLLLLAVGLGGFVAGMLTEQLDRVALPGGLLMLAAVVGFALFALLRFKGLCVRTRFWSNEFQWRTREEVPLRYWGFVILLSVVLVGLLLGAAGLLFVPSAFDRPAPPRVSTCAVFWMMLLLLVPGSVSVFCWLKAYARLKPNSVSRSGKLLLPRHVISAGRPWLLGAYLGMLAFILSILFICLTPWIIPPGE
jgi:drug/metabolite transporter (DMT)-like permease